MGALAKKRAAWLALPAALALCGCTGEDNDRLARVGRKMMVRAETLLGDADGRLSRGWQALRDTGEVSLTAKVSQRFAWDKALTEAKIVVQADGSTIELRGTVRDVAQRKRALDLAESTAGVERVIDSLQISEQDP
jgi:BON domain